MDEFFGKTTLRTSVQNRVIIPTTFRTPQPVFWSDLIVESRGDEEIKRASQRVAPIKIGVIVDGEKGLFDEKSWQAVRRGCDS